MNVAALNATSAAAGSSAAETAMVARSRVPLRPSALRQAAPEVQRAEVAAQFEAILVRQLLAPTMTSMLGPEGAASSVYGDMLTDTLSQQLTRGTGLGLGRLLEQQLTPRASTGALTSSASSEALL